MEMVGSKQTTAIAANAADSWDNLLPELLRLIASKLTNICDYIGFRCVCPLWRSAAGPADHASLFLPWMIIYACRSDNTAISFLNVADGRRHRLNLTEVKGKWIYGSSYGWLVMLDPSPTTPPAGFTAISLLNPITRAHIQLPAMPNSLVLCNNTNALLCSHPASPRFRQLQVVVWNYNSNTLALYRHGDDNWTMFDGKPSTIQLGDIAYFGESLYSIGLDRRLAVLDIASSTICQLVDPLPPDNHTNYSTEWTPINYLVKSSAGDLLLLEWFGKYVDDDQYVNDTHLFKLDVSGTEGWKWARVTDDNGGNSFTCHLKPFTSSDDGPNRGKLLVTIRPDLLAGVVADIAAGRLHCCQAYSREIWLIPSLY